MKKSKQSMVQITLPLAKAKQLRRLIEEATASMSLTTESGEVPEWLDFVDDELVKKFVISESKFNECSPYDVLNALLSLAVSKILESRAKPHKDPEKEAAAIIKLLHSLGLSKEKICEQLKYSSDFVEAILKDEEADEEVDDNSKDSSEA